MVFKQIPLLKQRALSWLAFGQCSARHTSDADRNR